MKLTTTEQKIAALAEMDGWASYHKPTSEEIASGSYYQYEPNYLTSYDSIIRATAMKEAGL